jgi:adrenodoxin-NADP+ reductase
MLQKTDITEYALDALSKSRIRQVYLVGRRGPLQAAFTTAELRELVKLPGCRPVFNPADFTGFQQQIDGN